MNRLFLALYILMLLFFFLDFFFHRKHMERKQQIVFYTLYILSAIGLYSVQYQKGLMMHIDFFLNNMGPRVKMWIDQIL